MLFVSPHPAYQLLGIRQPKIVRDPNSGEQIELTPGLDAEFVHGGCPSWAQDAAISNQAFQEKWSGLPDDVDRHLYISTFDTDKQAEARDWTPEEKELVERTLLRHSDFGSRYILMEMDEKVAELPWPNYNETHHFKIVERARDIGVDLEVVLEYEKTHKARPSVIEAVEAELAPDDLVAA